MKFSGYLLGGPVIALAGYMFYYLDKEMAVERSLSEPVKAEAQFVSAKCVDNVAYGRVMTPMMYTQYAFVVTSNGLAQKFETQAFKTYDTFAHCKQSLEIAVREKTTRVVWYEKNAPWKTSFDLDLNVSQANGKLIFLRMSLLLGCAVALFGLFDQRKRYTRRIRQQK